MDGTSSNGRSIETTSMSGIAPLNSHGNNPAWMIGAPGMNFGALGLAADRPSLLHSGSGSRPHTKTGDGTTTHQQILFSGNIPRAGLSSWLHHLGELPGETSGIHHRPSNQTLHPRPYYQLRLQNDMGTVIYATSDRTSGWNFQHKQTLFGTTSGNKAGGGCGRAWKANTKILNG